MCRSGSGWLSQQEEAAGAPRQSGPGRWWTQRGRVFQVPLSFQEVYASFKLMCLQPAHCGGVEAVWASQGPSWMIVLSPGMVLQANWPLDAVLTLALETVKVVMTNDALGYVQVLCGSLETG